MTDRLNDAIIRDYSYKRFICVRVAVVVVLAASLILAAGCAAEAS